MTFEGSGTGRELKKPIPEIREREGNKKSIPKFREWEGNEKILFPKFGNGKGMKKSIHTFWEQESQAIIPGNSWERE